MEGNSSQRDINPNQLQLKYAFSNFTKTYDTAEVPAVLWKRSVQGRSRNFSSFSYRVNVSVVVTSNMSHRIGRRIYQ